MAFQRPEPLAQAMIDRLFSALMLRYGSPFLDRWRDLDISVVKEDWSRQLAGASPLAIRFALDNLPEKPPTVIDFRKIMAQAPTAHESGEMLEYNTGPRRGPNAEERAKLKEFAQQVKDGTFFANPGRMWAIQVLHDHKQGWRNGKRWSATPHALAMAKDVLSQEHE